MLAFRGCHCFEIHPIKTNFINYYCIGIKAEVDRILRHGKKGLNLNLRVTVFTTRIIIEAQ